MELLDEVRFTAENLTPLVVFAAEGLVEELQTVHADVMEYIASLVRINFADETLRRARLSSKTRERLSRFLAVLGQQDVPLRDLRSGSHPLSALYRGTSIRTLERDLDLLERLGLLRREAGLLVADFGAQQP